MRSQLPDSDSIIKNYLEYKTKDVKWLWSSGWYDGPLSGMVKLDSEKYWVEFFDEEEWTESYGSEPQEADMFRASFFAILKLTNEQQKSEEYWHELFRICVSKRSDYDEFGNRSTQKVHGTNAMQRFYYTRRKMNYKELDLSESTLVGWFKY